MHRAVAILVIVATPTFDPTLKGSAHTAVQLRWTVQLAGSTGLPIRSLQGIRRSISVQMTSSPNILTDLRIAATATKLRVRAKLTSTSLRRAAVTLYP